MVKDSDIQVTVIQSVSRTGWRLAGIWTCAVVAGAAAAMKLEGAWTPILVQAAQCPVRWSGCLSVTWGPLLVSLLLSVLLGPAGIWTACLAEGFTLGLTAAAAGQCSGGVLFAGLLLFASVASAVVLLLLWQELLRTGTRYSRRLLYSAGLLTAIAAADDLVVSPFLVEVINF